MICSFVSCLGRETSDEFFIVRQLQENIWQKKETITLPSLTLKRPLTEFHVRYCGGL